MSMNISQSLLPEFDQETANARKLLERVPEDRPDFRPHPKSMPLKRLAAHVAELPGWAVMALTRDEMDFDPATFTPAMMTTRHQLLATFDEAVKNAREALASTGDDAMLRTWTLKVGGKPTLSLPRVAVVRSMMMNHLIHHRAQLGVYLRMNDVELPGMYGPSADEPSMASAGSR
jgi:uncharacterized damage-inducible protein DinB